MPQNPIATRNFPYPRPTRALNITVPTLVDTASGTISRVIVQVAGSAPGAINDSATIGGAAAANQIGVIPNTVGSAVFECPYVNGLVVTPGIGQTLAVVYTP